jgi:hypothetical protein
MRDTVKMTTIYTGYIYLPEMKQWKLLASFKAPLDGGYLKNLYSFVENFSGENGQLQREALYRNQWVQLEDGKWQELTTAVFSTDATGRAGDRIDYGAGESDGQFYLWNGGFQPANVKMGVRFYRPPAAGKAIRYGE